jgi:hypothetical protein
MRKTSMLLFAGIATLPLVLACETLMPLRPLPDGGAGNPVVTCDPFERFVNAGPVAGLNRNSGYDWRVYLSPDERTAYVSTGDYPSSDIVVAKRASTAEPFGEGDPLPLAGINGPYSELSVSVTADGLTLFMESHRTERGRIYVATRKTVNESFGQPTEVLVLAGSAGDGDPYVLPDGSALYFTSWATTTARGFIYRATLDGITVGKAAVIASDLMERWPVVSADELVLYAYGNDGANPGIWMSARTSRDLPFRAPVFLSELDTPEEEFPQWISPDGCRLYFGRASSLNFLFVGERAQN